MIGDLVNSNIWVVFPIVFLLGLAGIILLLKLYKDTIYMWYLISVLALFASFSVFQDPFGRPTPNLVFPLQQLRQYGRIISVGLLGFICIYIYIISDKVAARKIKDTFFIKNALLAIQILIFVKNLLYGDVITAFLILFIFLAIYLVFYHGVSHWLVSKSFFKTSIFSFIIAIVLFNFMCLYQSFFDPEAMRFLQGRFLGMTGNPQHAAVLLTSGIPIFIVFIIDRTALWERVLLVLGLLWSIKYLIDTGSRTGILMGLLAVLIFLSGYKASSSKILVIGSIIGLVVLSIVDFNPLANSDKEVIDRYSSTENTRAEVIQVQINQFKRAPLFGVDPRGGRVGFSENSYLAVAASLGIVGLLPLLFVIIGVFKLIITLWKKSKNKKDKHFYYLVISGLLSLMAGALVEAYLLGSLTWPIILLFCYVHWGYYLLQQNEEVYELSD